MIAVTHEPAGGRWRDADRPYAAAYDGLLIEAKDHGNGVSVVQADSVDKVEYFHIELESRDLIVAEGAFSESYIDDDNRSMFHNAGEFQELYPMCSAGGVRYCAPRLEDGQEVEAERHRIALRAGLLNHREGEEEAPVHMPQAA
ncbi:Hint domain-containing protein [Bradyrhizobium guangzhouense]|uniref:Hint domain-containing protein n=1 Tax=Bradyrhizobium guangzhouense TaxID=1325095 RepID=UPI0032214615